MASSAVSLEDRLATDSVALHINVGDRAKTPGLENSVSGQFASLRQIFDNSTTSPVIRRALNKEIPVVAYVHQADEIMALVSIVFNT